MEPSCTPGPCAWSRERESVDSETEKGNAPVHETGTEVLKIRLALKGRPLRVCTFKKDVVTIGRDPDSDIYLDNPGISRHHLRLERCAEGFYAEDLESANGTFLNDEPIRKALLRDEDVLRVGKFSLWVSYDKDRRGSGAQRAVSPSTFQGTTVLSTSELDDMLARAREEDTAAAEPEPVLEVPPVRTFSRAWVIGAALSSFVCGTAVGATLFWLVFVH